MDLKTQSRLISLERDNSDVYYCCYVKLGAEESGGNFGSQPNTLIHLGLEPFPNIQRYTSTVVYKYQAVSCSRLCTIPRLQTQNFPLLLSPQPSTPAPTLSGTYCKHCCHFTSSCLKCFSGCCLQHGCYWKHDNAADA